MRTLDEIQAAARPRSAFSNGTEGYSWTSNWCDRCVHDKGARDDSDPAGCPILMVSLLGSTPSEWLEQPWQQVPGRPEGTLAPSLGDRYHCVEFRDENNPGPGYEEQPDPPVPGQLAMFDAEPYQGVRMFVQPPMAEVQS